MPRPSSAFTSRRDGWPDSIANALLIAAAPEILEALKAILDRPDADARMIAAAAVARAEGR